MDPLYLGKQGAFSDLGLPRGLVLLGTCFEQHQNVAVVLQLLERGREQTDDAQRDLEWNAKGRAGRHTNEQEQKNA